MKSLFGQPYYNQEAQDFFENFSPMYSNCHKVAKKLPYRSVYMVGVGEKSATVGQTTQRDSASLKKNTQLPPTRCQGQCLYIAEGVTNAFALVEGVINAFTLVE